MPAGDTEQAPDTRPASLAAGRRKASFRGRLTWLMLLLTVVPIIVSGVIFLLSARSLTRAEVLRHMDAVAQTKCDILGRLARDWVWRLSTLTSSPEVRDEAAKLAQAHRRGVAPPEALRNDMQWKLMDLALPGSSTHGEVLLVDLSDNTVLAWVGLVGKDQAQSKIHHSRQQLQRCIQPWLSRVHVSPHSQDLVVDAVQVIPPLSGAPGTAQTAVIWIQHLAEVVYPHVGNRYGLGDTGEIVVTDEQGLAIKDLYYESGTALRKTIHTQMVTRALRGESGVLMAQDYRGRPVLAAFRQVPTLRWALVVKMDADEAFAGYNRMAYTWSLALLLLLLLSVLLVRRAAVAIARPILNVSGAALRLAEGDREARAETGRTDELGQLAESFNAMAAQVGLTRQNLEQMVAERSQELNQRVRQLNCLYRLGQLVQRTDLATEGLLQAVAQLIPGGWQDPAGTSARITLDGSGYESPGFVDSQWQQTADIIIAGKTAGVVEVFTHEPHLDSVLTQDTRLLAAIAERLGQAIEQTRTAVALRANERMRASLLEALPLRVMFKNNESIYVYSNSAYAADLGMKPEDLAGKSDYDLYPLELAEKYRTDDRRVMRSGAIEEFEEAYRQADRELLIHTIKVPIMDLTGQPQGIWVIFWDITEQRRAEIAVRESEERYRSLFENMLNGFAYHEIVVDDEGKPIDYIFREVNPAFERLTGVPREQLLGKRLLEALPGTESTWIDTYGKVALTGEEARLEDYTAPLGKWFSVLAYSPQPRHFATVFEDITERKLAEMALRATNERLEAVINAAPVSIAIFDPAGRIRMWNPAAERIYQWQAKEVIGKFNPTLDEESVDDFRQLLKSVIAGHTIETVERLRYRKDGTPVEVSISGGPLRSSDGQVMGMLSITIDISERRRAEREHEERTALDQLVRVTREVLAQGTPDEMLQVVADAARSLTGAKIACTVHGSLDTALTMGAISRSADLPPGPEGVSPCPERDRACASLLRDGSTARVSAEELRQHPDFRDLPEGHVPLQGFLGAALVGADGRPNGMIVVSIKEEGEFTARDEALLSQLATFASLGLQHLYMNEQLERRAFDLAASNHELEAFAYSVSHDLRAPLRAIDGFSQAVLEDYDTKLDDQGRHYLRRIRAGTQRMGSLIDDLLQLSRVSREQMQREAVNLSELAEEIIGQLRAGDPQREVGVEIEPGLLAVGDRRLLHTLLLNLLDNAWKFTAHEPQATIQVGSMETADGPAFYVRDNGAGFDMTYVGKLFAPFQRLHTVDEFPGNGVGLATVQRVASRHGGRAWAEGQAGQGATFYFTLHG